MYAAARIEPVKAASPGGHFVLEAKGICKAYGHVQALDIVSLITGAIRGDEA